MATTQNREFVRRKDLTFSDRVRAFSPIDSRGRELIDLFDQLREVLKSDIPLSNRIVAFDLRSFDFSTVDVGTAKAQLAHDRFAELAPCLVLAPPANHGLFSLSGFHPVADENALYTWLCDHQVKKRETSPTPLFTMTWADLEEHRTNGVPMDVAIDRAMKVLGVAS
jgi:hypothetical protein